MIVVHKGSQTAIWKAGHDILVNPVNCIGVQGAGFAKEVAERFPMFADQYREACRYRQITLGRCVYVPVSLLAPCAIIAFPTKHHWRDLTDPADVVAGLKSLRALLADRVPPTLTVGLPAIGCGLGGLEWSLVEGLIRAELDGVENTIIVYPPNKRTDL